MNTLIDTLRACIAQAERGLEAHTLEGADVRLQAIRELAQGAIDAFEQPVPEATPKATSTASPEVDSLTLQAEVMANLAGAARMEALAVSSAPGSLRGRQAACLDWLSATLGYQLYLQGKAEQADPQKLVDAERELARQFSRVLPGSDAAEGLSDTQLLAWLADNLHWDGESYWLPELCLRTRQYDENPCPEPGLEGVRSALANLINERSLASS